MADERHSRLVEYRRGLARYCAVERVAVGGMGEVWRGEANFADGHVEEVAIKRVRPWLANDSMYRLMLEDEARLGMLLRHDNIVRVYDARTQGSFILVMEYVAGCSLHQLLGHMQARHLKLPLAASLHIALGLTRALHYAHEALDEWGRELAVIHGDVSPQNVLLSIRGEVKLMDFGLARASANLVKRDPNKVSGKPGYVAPELVIDREASQLNDLFALGIVVWECVTGRRLFKGKSAIDDLCLVRRCDVPLASSYNAAVTRELDAILNRLLAKDPAERYPSAHALNADLEPLVDRLGGGLGRGQLAHLTRRVPMGASAEGQPHAAQGSPETERSHAELDDVITSVYPRLLDAGSSQELC